MSFAEDCTLGENGFLFVHHKCVKKLSLDLSIVYLKIKNEIKTSINFKVKVTSSCHRSQFCQKTCARWFPSYCGTLAPKYIWVSRWLRRHLIKSFFKQVNLSAPDILIDFYTETGFNSIPDLFIFILENSGFFFE